MHRPHLGGQVDPDSIATRREFASALTTVREAAGLTVREVARASGISSSTVGGYFSGRHLPPLRPDGGIGVILAACGVTAPAEHEAWQRALARVRRAPGPRPGALPAPYPGLLAYGPDDAELFHGRRADTDHVLDRLCRHPGDGDDLVVLLGRAGSGKSSLVGAGVIPALRARRRPVVVLVPGADPLHDLAVALAALGGIDPTTATTALQAGPTAVRTLVPVLVPVPVPSGAGTGPEEDLRPVVVVDHFEAVLRAGIDVARQRAFIRALGSLARPGPHAEPPATILVVLRTEAIPAVARFADLASALQSPGDAGPGHTRAVHLTSMDDDALRAAIVLPARRAGAGVEPELVDTVLADLAELERQGAATLPRLSHALLATWRRDRRGWLTLAGYREAGGVLGAVDLAAEAVYRSLPDDARAALPELLMTDGPPAGTGSSAAAETALRAFAEAGLLARPDPNGRPGRPPSPGLLEGWSRVQQWRCGEPATDLSASSQTVALPDGRTGDAPERRRWWPRRWRRN